MRFLALVWVGCTAGSPTPVPSESDTDTDSDTDSDTDADSDADTDTDTEVDTDPSCQGRDEASCRADPACWAFDGTVCGDLSVPVYVGCLDADSECADITWACHPVGQPDACVWLPAACDFPGYCPAGWEDCGADPTSYCDP